MMYAVLLVLCEWCGDHRDLRVLTHSFPTRRSSYRQRYYRDGGHGNYHGNITDHYDIRTGRWFRSDVEQVPDGRIMGTYFGWGRGYNYAPWERSAERRAGNDCAGTCHSRWLPDQSKKQRTQHV